MKDFTDKKTVGAVAIMGSGVAGLETALNLAESGIKVYLIEKLPSIGGIMAQLDKTFPTNDCSMCILAPRLVQTQRHPNIEILTNSEAVSLEGEKGNFTLTINKKARFVDEDLCVGCGDCWEKCPVKNIPAEFDYGLSKRTAVYRMFPQAIPNVPVIDSKNCLKLKNGKCGICEKICKPKAINYDMKDKEIKLNVGSIVAAPGYKLVDPNSKKEFGYGRYKNVVTSLEFERILNASGPFEGKVIRPSDKKHPKKIAFIQCVGSRDSENDYCSSVCCMYAAKESLIAMEHEPGLECSVFFIDMRSHGKGFEAYYERAKEHGVRYIRCRPSAVKEIPDSKNLEVRYLDEGGDFQGEEFDMVVLSLGMRPPAESEKINGLLGLKSNKFGFCAGDSFESVKTQKEGVYICGPYTEPKDIPETVIEASGAASKALAVVASQKGSLVAQKKYPEQRDVSDEEARVGVFICHCGTNIAGVVNVPDVVEYAKGIKNVVFATNTIYACANDSIEKIVATIKEHKLNRLVVSACTPRTHETLFRSAMSEAGLNPYLFEMANIRDQNSWVHMKDPKFATEKAKELTRMAVAKSCALMALKPRTMKVLPSAIVIGGGMSGMTAALDLASHGVEVDLVEETSELGGNMRDIKYLLSGDNPAEKISKAVREIEAHQNIHVMLNSKISKIEGSWGNFHTTIAGKDNSLSEIRHGVFVVATGAKEYKPKEYLYGSDPRIITQHELESSLSEDKFKKRSIVMIQCVGSRSDEHPYCSRVCCSQAVKNALVIKEKNPEAEVYVLYRDIRTYGFREEYYTRAREKGVVFLRFEDGKEPEISKSKDMLNVKLADAMLKKTVVLEADSVVLSTGIAPNPGNKELSEFLKVPVNQDGFFLEAHMKLRPVDFSSDGIFLCGLAHCPKDASESVTQASAAAARASTIALKGTAVLDSHYAIVDDSNCDGCALCVATCPYNAITLTEYAFKGQTKKIIEVNPGLCKGCGVCQATCPKNGVGVQGFTIKQINAMIDSLFEKKGVK